jgi:fatty acid desaturase
MGETDGLRRTRLGRMAVSGSNEVPAPQERRTATADGSWMLWTAIGIGGIWVAVVLISLLSPDMVSGSEQEHQKVAAFVTWFWGGVGTLVFLWAMGRLRGDAMWRPTWIGLSSVTLGIWALATIIAIALPVVETGSDPTQIPVGAVVGPVAAAMLTAIAGAVTSVFRRGPGPR